MYLLSGFLPVLSGKEHSNDIPFDVSYDSLAGIA